MPSALELRPIRTTNTTKTNLHKSEVFLPPDVLGVHADKVVRVHDSVDEAVQEDGQVHVSVIAGVHVQPVELTSNQTSATREKT